MTKTDVSLVAADIRANGPYDIMYRELGVVWREAPGRMVYEVTGYSDPGLALDLGCGDFRNALFLQDNGWAVDCVDISPSAIEAGHQRAARRGVNLMGQTLIADAASVSLSGRSYDMIVSYGLYHCLDESQLQRVHELTSEVLKSGGLLVFSTLIDGIPIPSNHPTGALHLRSEADVLSMFVGWEIVTHRSGVIEEDHLPLIGLHQHSVLWMILKKPELSTLS